MIIGESVCYVTYLGGQTNLRCYCGVSKRHKVVMAQIWKEAFTRKLLVTTVRTYSNWLQEKSVCVSGWGGPKSCNYYPKWWILRWDGVQQLKYNQGSISLSFSRLLLVSFSVLLPLSSSKMFTRGPRLTSTGKIKDLFQKRILSLSCMLIPEQISMTGGWGSQVGQIWPVTVLETKRKESAPSAPHELNRLTRELRQSEGRQKSHVHYGW